MEIFFALLRSALWGLEAKRSKEQSERGIVPLLRMAEEQTVVGLVTTALFGNDVRMEQMQLFEMIGLLEQIKASNRTINGELLDFVKMLDEAGLDYIVFKGQTVATLYPDPLLRMPGDIDFLVYDYSASRQLLKDEWNISLPNDFIGKEIAFEHGGAVYELHRELITFRRRKHQRYWQGMMGRPHRTVVDIEGHDVKTLSPQINAVYVFAHLFFHFIREGIGLRQMCDWAMVLDRYKDNIDRAQLEADLEGVGIRKAYCAFGGVLVGQLGLKSFPFELTTEDTAMSGKIIDDIIRYGNFGKPSRRVQSSGWRFKCETMGRTVRNCWKYWHLAPSEIAMVIPRLAVLNVKLTVASIVK